jgi:hypothetical protein
MRINFEKTFDKLFTFVRNIVVNILKLSFFDFLKELILIFGTEWIISLEHYIKENSKRPHIRVDWGMIKFRNDFRGHICGSATKGINCLIFGASETEAKVN